MIDLTNIVDPEKEYSRSELQKTFRVAPATMWRWLRDGLVGRKESSNYSPGYVWKIKGSEVIKYLSKFNE